MKAFNYYFLLALLFPKLSLGDNNLNCLPTTNQKLQKIEIKMSKDAVSLSQKLINLGFKCDQPPPSFERGFRCRGKIANYPQPINIFIPSQYAKESAGPLALHFHGHNLTNAGDPSIHFNTDNGNGDYGKMLSSSGSNSLLVIPESLGKCETYASQFKSTADLDNFLHDVESATDRKISTISFSSHSGGDRTMDRLASWYLSGNRGEFLGRTQNIALFDSLYANRESLARWPQALKNADSNSKFLGSYVIGPGASTTKNMAWLKTKVPSSDTWQFREVQTHHMAIMRDGGFSEYLAFTNKK